MPSSVPALGGILRELERTEPGWFALAQCDARDAERLFRDEIKQAITRPPSLPNGPPGLTRKELDPALSYCDLAVVHFFDIALICYERIESSERLMWPEKDGPNGTFILQVLSANIANTLLAVRHLAADGYGPQARVLLRQYVEMCDATVACAYDYDFFRAFVDADPDPDTAFRYWNKHLKPSRVRSLLERLDAEIGYPEPLRSRIAAMRAGTYGWLSNHSHVHSLGLILSGLARATDERGHLIPRCGAIREQDARHVLFQAAQYSWITSLHLGWLLSAPHHGWYALVTKGDRLRAWCMFRREVLTRLFRHQFEAMSHNPHGSDSTTESSNER